MFVKYTISGNSMYPTFKAGETVLAYKFPFLKIKTGDVVIAKDPRTDRLLLKRIKEIKNNRYFLVGDNEKESTDSREFGFVDKKLIIGKVFLKL